MKPTAVIFALLIGFLILQPGWNVVRSTSDITTFVKNEQRSSCSKNTCEKNVPQQEEDCGMKRCNPLMGCPSGNFYAHFYNNISIASLILVKQTPIVENDNRILQQSSDCWHPPEV